MALMMKSKTSKVVMKPPVVNTLGAFLVWENLPVDIFSTYSYFLQSQSPLKPVKMKENETHANKNVH
jgi:hypothetical protein